jgi:hypothetical protein
MNNNDQNNSKNKLTFTQILKDFYSWIRGHENLYQCLIKTKHFMVNNMVLLAYIVFIYYIYKKYNI